MKNSLRTSLGIESINATVIAIFSVLIFLTPIIGHAQIPANDACSGATALTVNAAAIGGTLLNSTATAANASNSIYSTYKDVWYSFVPTCDTITISIIYKISGSDIYFEVYKSATCPTTASAIVQNYLGSTSSAISQLTALTIGSNYYIRLIDHSSKSPDFTIALTKSIYPHSPVLTTDAASNMASSTATLNGTISKLPCPTTSKGFVYALTSKVGSDPTNLLKNSLSNVTTTSVAGLTTGAYSLALTGLNLSTGYSFRAYVFDGTTYSYGAVQTLTTLPLTWLSFQTKLLANKQVQLEWKTASEINVKNFVIERSADGLNFTPILNPINAHNTLSDNTYSTIDEQPLSGVSYYRIVETDFDGQFNYSQVRSVNNIGGETQFVVFPNPVTAKSVLSISTNWNENFDFILTDLLGRVIYNAENLKANLVELKDLSLLSGIYLYECRTNKALVIGKIVVKD